MGPLSEIVLRFEENCEQRDCSAVGHNVAEQHNRLQGFICFGINRVRVGELPNTHVKIRLCKNRYVGDIGDFGKYALLDALAAKDLRLGVHLYLNADEEQNSDGKFTDYGQLRHCDERLYSALQQLVKNGQRTVASVQRAAVLPGNTIYFSTPLSSRENWGRAERRDAWNARA